MKIDEKVNNKNIKLFEKYGTHNNDDIYTCGCCGKKTSIPKSCSVGGAYLVCTKCSVEKFHGWYKCREWQEKMLAEKSDKED